MHSDPKFIPASCGGERCTICGEPAQRKVEENIFDDDPVPARHPYTAYVCLAHFDAIMRLPTAADFKDGPYWRGSLLMLLDDLRRDAPDVLKKIREKSFDDSDWGRAIDEVLSAASEQRKAL